jgi:hypothetical protein
MEMTDQFYSNINDGDVKNRISKLGKDKKIKSKMILLVFKNSLNGTKSKRLVYYLAKELVASFFVCGCVLTTHLQFGE